MNIRSSFFARRALLLVALIGSWVQAQATEPPLRVVASFSILADMVREIGGDAVSVSALVGPDADAHVFQPSPADAKRLANAELVVINGLGFEGWMARLIKASGYRGPLVVATTGIKPRLVNGQPDPHAWQSLPNARLYTENIRAALVKARPDQRAAIDARAVDFLRRIDALDAELRARLAPVPLAQRRVITAHDAFGYLGAEYGVVFIAPQGWSTDSEASAADVARIIRQIKAQRARAVFVENITDPRLVQRIAGEAGAAVGGTLYSDALSGSGGPADTYLRMYSHNAQNLSAALGATPATSTGNKP